MQSAIAAVFILGVIIILYLRHVEYFDATSRVDNRVYPVLDGFADSTQAADRLAEINRKNSRLISYMVAKYPAPGTHGNLLATRLQARYKSDRLVENDPVDKNNTSYTEDKGEKIAFCLREKVTGNNRLHDHSILEFVDLHELAHIASEGYGHDDEFWSNFAFLLREAKAAGIHTPKDYGRYPVNYCGLDVGYNPYYDASLA